MNELESARMHGAEAEHWWYRSLHSFLLRRLRKQLPRDARVLDLGCGSGLLLARLSRELGAVVSGVDLRDESVSLARSRGLAVQQGHMLSHLRAVPGRFDLILLIDSFYFLNDEERAELLKLAARKLSPNGRLVLHLPGGKLFRREHDSTVGITERFHYGMVRRAFRAAGVENEMRLRARRRVCALSAGILVRKAFQFARPSASPRSDLVPLPRWLNTALRALQSAEDRLPAVPWGSSLYVEATRRA